MKSIKRKMMTAYFAPIVVGVLRVIVSGIILVSNPQELPLKLFQLIPTFIILGSLFTYIKLYNDSDPIVALVLPSIIHFVVILVFTKKVVLVPFILPVALDLIYLVAKGVKSELYPFEIEGDEEGTDEELEEEEYEVFLD